MMDTVKYKTVPEAAAILGIRPGTLYAYIYRRQVIPADAVQKVGTGWIIRADWIYKRKEKKGDTMKKLLTMESLTATHYDAPDHILQFEPGDGRKIFVTVRGVGPVDDEFYWDDEDTLTQALAEVKEEDIEVQRPTIPVSTDRIIEDSNLTLKDKRFVRSVIDRDILTVLDADLPLLKYWIENEQLDSYRPMFYGGYTPEQFQAEQVEQFGEEVDLEDRQWYTVLPEGIIEYTDEPGWWK